MALFGANGRLRGNGSASGLAVGARLRLAISLAGLAMGYQAGSAQYFYWTGPGVAIEDLPVAPAASDPNMEHPMIWTMVIILVVLWLLGFISGSVGSLIHILLVIAIIVVLIRVIQGRRPI